MSSTTDTDVRVDANAKALRQRNHQYTREQWDSAGQALDQLLEQPARIHRSTLATEIVALLPRIRALRAKGRSLGEIVNVLGTCGIAVSEATLRRIERHHSDEQPGSKPSGTRWRKAPSVREQN